MVALSRPYDRLYNALRLFVAVVQSGGNRETALALPPPKSNVDCNRKEDFWQDTPRYGLERGPSAYHTDAGKTLSFSAAGPVDGRRWRLPGTQMRDLRLLKTPKTATVVSTPLAIW